MTYRLFFREYVHSGNVLKESLSLSIGSVSRNAPVSPPSVSIIFSYSALPAMQFKSPHITATSMVAFEEPTNALERIVFPTNAFISFACASRVSLDLRQKSLCKWALNMHTVVSSSRLLSATPSMPLLKNKRSPPVEHLNSWKTLCFTRSLLKITNPLFDGPCTT